MQTIVVVGASLGGVEALRALVAGLPAGFAAAVFVVLHIGAHKSELPELLSQAGVLPAIHPKGGDTICAGHIYVAPPDHHLTIEPGTMRLTRGPRENWARPAIDPLFRSAAHAYGKDVIGIILTGALNDGTAGLYEVMACRGVTIVQDPADAVNASMPRSALAHVKIDHCVPLATLPSLLVSLVAPKTSAIWGDQPGLATRRLKDMTINYTHDRPTAITCPDCGGALRRTELGSLKQFRCHIGHVYTAEVMMEAQSAAMERSLATALRSLRERAELCRLMGAEAHRASDAQARDHWEMAEAEAQRQSATLQILLESPGGASAL